MPSFLERLLANIFRGAIPAWTVAVVFTGLTGCRKHAAGPEAPTNPVVETTVVGTAEVPITRRFSGTVRAVRTVDIIPQVTGILQKRFFTEGAFVQEGDPLYLIDPRPFEAALAEAKAQLEEDLASSKFYEEEAARYKKAQSRQAASVEALQQAEAKKTEADAAALKDRAAVEAAKLDLAYTKITAPFSGRVQATQKNVGALVTEEKDILTTLVQIDPVYVEFAVSRREMFAIRTLQGEGFLFSPDVHVELILPNGKPHPKKGKIDFVASQVNPLTDGVLVRAVVPNAGGDGPGVNLISGQYVEVNLVLGNRSNAVVIPQEALLETQAGTLVYVVGEGGKVEIRMVETGPVHDRYQVINSGLKPGENIVTLGLQRVRNGVTVKIEPAATPVPAAPTGTAAKATPAS
jgi:membrane fusion protein (multidrug efflux system)